MVQRRTPFAVLAAAVLVAGLLLALPAAPRRAEAKADAYPGGRDVIVHLFEWPWKDVATECTTVLGPKGFGAVQVSPPQEHVRLQSRGYPWWQDYQPVSYTLTSRRGTRADFAAMVSTCHTAGVKIYVDAVVNHMTGGASAGSGPGTAGDSYTQYSYPAVSYGYTDFHHCGRNGNDDIANWTDRWEVQNCELVDLADLATESSNVRTKLAGYLADLRSLGVDGFRVDAAKHVPVADLSAIYSQAGGAPYIYQEVIEGGSGEISPTEYTGIGDVTEFRYGDVVGNAFRDANFGNLANLPGQMLLGSGDAVAFVDNHDTQRNGRARLTYKDGTPYALAEAFMLAYPYGVPQVMSSFSFSSSDQGPPSASDGTTSAVSCGNGWVCEHRWRTTQNMVGFHNAVSGTGVTQWWTGNAAQVAFGRGGNGYVVFNRDGNALSRTFQTNLPAGTYCDVANGDYAGGTCSGPVYTVNSSGQFTATVAANTMLALHIDARTGGGGGGCTAIATTFTLHATPGSGDTFAVVGDQAALGSWNTANAVSMPLVGTGVYRATVNLTPGVGFQYKYIRRSSSGAVTWEYDPNRSHTTPTSTCSVSYDETWNGPAPSGSCTSIAVTFKATVSTAWGENVYVVGNQPALGDWNTTNAVALSSATYPVWVGTVNLPPDTSVQYKYIKKNGSTVTWESDPNRALSTGTACSMTVNDTWR
jgi:alpha-amylase